LKDVSQTSGTPTASQTGPTSNDPTTTPAPEGAPEAYTFTAPEGKSYDKSFIDKATPVFKELNLTQASAQKLVDTYNDLAQSQADLAVKAVEDMRRGWQADVTKEFGGKVDEIKADVGRMYDTLFKDAPKDRDAFINAMNLTGAGDHPAIVKTMWKLSEAFREGQHVSGGGPSPHGQRQPNTAAAPSAAQAMYPNLPSSAAAVH
jgi:hypothetical protein